MKLFEVQATEYNGEQEYFQSKLLVAENIDQAWQIARDYFRGWYDDAEEPQDHNTDNPDEFEFVGGCIRLKIKSVQETTLDEWIKTQITLHSISKLSDELITRRIAAPSDKFLIECFISEQCSELPCKKLPVNIMAESGKLWIQPAGFSDKTSADGHGWPIGLEIWQGRLRLIIFDDINTEEPKIIDLEKAKETARKMIF